MSLFTLDDPRPNAAEAPYTYFLPLPDHLAALQRDDSVKLVFRPTASGTKWDAERMWVTVTRVDGDHLEGVLDNHPDDIPGLEAGASVSFFLWHVIAIQFDPEHQATPQPDPRREYWERCMVDKAVIQGELKVDYIYREAPDLAGADDNYPDSGWRIRGDLLNATDAEIDARETAYIAIGAILNRDSSWLHLIDEPVGTAFRRNFDDDTYAPENR